MKAETHQAITRLAIERFLALDETQLSKALQRKRYSGQLLWGTKDEDGLNPSRALNWHSGRPVAANVRTVEKCALPRKAVS